MDNNTKKIVDPCGSDYSDSEENPSSTTKADTYVEKEDPLKEDREKCKNLNSEDRKTIFRENDTTVYFKIENIKDRKEAEENSKKSPQA